MVVREGICKSSSALANESVEQNVYIGFETFDWQPKREDKGQIKKKKVNVCSHTSLPGRDVAKSSTGQI